MVDVRHCFDTVLWHCWLGGRKGIRPVKTEWWGAGVVVCLEQGASLHMAQLMPLPLTVSCFSKIQIGFTFLVPAHLGSPGKRAVKRVCVYRNGFLILIIIAYWCSLKCFSWWTWLVSHKGWYSEIVIDQTSPLGCWMYSTVGSDGNAVVSLSSYKRYTCICIVLFSLFSV